jgi:hypothetical protein
LIVWIIEHSYDAQVGATKYPNLAYVLRWPELLVLTRFRRRIEIAILKRGRRHDIAHPVAIDVADDGKGMGKLSRARLRGWVRVKQGASDRA